MRIVEIIPPNQSVDLSEKEKIFMQIQQQILLKRKFLLEQQQRINKIKQHNEFLENVRNDYSKYNKYISDEREKQIQAFTMLNQYLNDLTTSGKLSKNNIKDAKAEQKKILNEIENIKIGLDEIMKE
jgi:hypothetical protein